MLPFVGTADCSQTGYLSAEVALETQNHVLSRYLSARQKQSSGIVSSLWPKDQGFGEQKGIAQGQYAVAAGSVPEVQEIFRGSLSHLHWKTWKRSYYSARKNSCERIKQFSQTPRIRNAQRYHLWGNVNQNSNHPDQAGRQSHRIHQCSSCSRTAFHSKRTFFRTWRSGLVGPLIWSLGFFPEGILQKNWNCLFGGKERQWSQLEAQDLSSRKRTGQRQIHLSVRGNDQRADRTKQVRIQNITA